MKLYITRDSVAAGDDVDAPHASSGSVGDSPNLDELVTACLAACPLPSIAGGRATWCLSSRIPLAVIAQQWRSPKPVVDDSPSLNSLDLVDGVLRLHFTYFAQHEPENVYEILSRLRLCADTE